MEMLSTLLALCREIYQFPSQIAGNLVFVCFLCSAPEKIFNIQWIWNVIMFMPCKQCTSIFKGQRRGSVSLRIHQPSGGTSTPGPGDPILEEFGEETETVTETVTRQDSSSSATDAYVLNARAIICGHFKVFIILFHWRWIGYTVFTLSTCLSVHL